jgi:hypothetical protein
MYLSSAVHILRLLEDKEEEITGLDTLVLVVQISVAVICGQMLYSL